MPQASIRRPMSGSETVILRSTSSPQCGLADLVGDWWLAGWLAAGWWLAGWLAGWWAVGWLLVAGLMAG
eukprot:536282-Karenia_brevis.AAC.1